MQKDPLHHDYESLGVWVGGGAIGRGISVGGFWLLPVMYTHGVLSPNERPMLAVGEEDNKDEGVLLLVSS